MSNFVKAVPGIDRSVIYTDDKGRYFRFSGGTLAWRNHNPGNVRPGNISKKHNQIGVAYNLAVFPDYEAGHEALLDVLRTTYANYSIAQMMQKYAPPFENNTRKYIKFLREVTDVKDNKKIKDFSPIEFEKLWKGIERMEGTKKGTIIEVFQVSKVRTNNGAISSFYVNNNWISKEQCIKLVQKGAIDLEACSSELGNTYLRTPPNTVFQKKLGSIIEKKHKE